MVGGIKYVGEMGSVRELGTTLVAGGIGLQFKSQPRKRLHFSTPPLEFGSNQKDWLTMEY